MTKRKMAHLLVFLLMGAVPSSVARAEATDGVQMAFADIVAPRGIKLSNGAEDATPEESGAAVTFDEAFEGIDSTLDGKSLSDLATGTPLFSPIEGLPESVWKDKECTTCHAWTQDALCTQGQFYVKQGFNAVDRKQHPYGGMFKKEVMAWAQRGCK